jgi:serine protease inhibitor
MPLRSFIRTVLPSLFLAAACSQEPTGLPSELTALPRELSAAEQRVVAASNGFAFELFRRAAAAQDSNVFVSPLSVSMALGMSLNGAAGATLDSMRLALGLGEASVAEINDGYRNLIALLGGLDRRTRFDIANSVWYRQGFAIHPTFLDATRQSFDAEVTGLDFGSPSAVTTINDWVARSTAGKIDRIIDGIEQDDVAFLINAIYFKGDWRTAFDRGKTADGTFRASVGGDQTVSMMRHAAGDEGAAPDWLSTPFFDAVELPYGNAAFAMTVLLPNEGVGVDALVDSLTSERWAGWATQFRPSEAGVRLPKFKLEYARTLNDDLAALGMGIAFDSDLADFGPMTTDDSQVYITRVTHKTFVDVYEEGTEAAAVTSTGFGVTSAPPTLDVDRPFVFFIRERLSGTILFMGKIVRIPQ